MNCETAQERILEAIDARPGSIEREQLDVHLAGCARCAAFARRQLELDRALAAKFADVAPADSLPARILAASVQEAGGTGPAWAPDLINAAGAILCGGALASLAPSFAADWAALFFLLVAVGIGCYPLVLLRVR